jgi:hypothetical protein
MLARSVGEGEPPRPFAVRTVSPQEAWIGETLSAFRVALTAMGRGDRMPAKSLDLGPQSTKLILVVAGDGVQVKSRETDGGG